MSESHATPAPKRPPMPFRERVVMLRDALAEAYGGCFEETNAPATPLDRRRAALCIKQAWLGLHVWEGWDIGEVAWRAASLHEEVFHFLQGQRFTSTETPQEAKLRGSRRTLPVAEQKTLLTVPTCARWDRRNTSNGCACLEAFLEMVYGLDTAAKDDGRLALRGASPQGVRLAPGRLDAASPSGVAVRGVELPPAGVLAGRPGALPERKADKDHRGRCSGR